MLGRRRAAAENATGGATAPLLRTMLGLIPALVLATACALAVVLDNPAPAAAQATGETPGDCGPSWGALSSAPGFELPQAIVPLAPDDVWVVGNSGLTTPGAGYIRARAEHWDGASWTAFPTPDVGPYDSLYGADAVSSTDIWAVGYYAGADTKPKTLIERWDGDSWKVVPSPNPSQEHNALTDVESRGSNAAWAVGNHRVGVQRKPLVERWDGSSWSVEADIPNLANGADGGLLGVAAPGTANVWAVGYESGDAGYRSLVLHYDGTAWTEVEVPVAGDGDNVLTGISTAGEDELWAVGYYVEGAHYKALTLRYDGSQWRHVPGAGPGDGLTVLRGIEGSPSDAWAVGFEYRADLNHYVSSTQHWDGTSWTASTSALAHAGAQSEMFDVARAPGASQVWASGETGFGQSGSVETICPPDEPTPAANASVSPEDSPRPPEPSSSAETAPEEENTATSTVAAGEGIPVKALDKARDAGIYETTRTYGAVVADLDDDGLEDIFLNRHHDPARLYHNDGGGRFAEVEQEEAFASQDRHGCDAADVNNDGLEDVFCAEGADGGVKAKRNYLWVQQPDHTFADQTRRYGLLEPFGRGRFGAFFDANGDDYPDLYVGNDVRQDGMPSPNRLFINEGGSSYRYAPESGLEHETGTGRGGGSEAEAADFDGDGWEDLLTEDEDFVARLFRNDEGQGFTDVSGSAGFGNEFVRDAVVADMNGDGWPDVVQVTRDRLRVLLNANGTFSSAFSAPVRYGTAVAAGDVNGDGRPDLYVLRHQDGSGANAPDQVYLNDGTGTGFAPMPNVPSTTEGVGESVWPVDHDSNGLTDFLVLNGLASTHGPVQLVAFYPDDGPPETAMDSAPSGISNKAAATFAFSSSEEGSTFECSLDGAAWSACSSPKDYAGLADGSHAFEVRATDAAGDVDPTPASHSWSVDTAAPAATPPAPGLIQGSVLGTSTVPVRLSWSATDGDPGGSGVARYYLQQRTNGGAFVNVPLPTSTATNATLPLSPGNTYRFRVRAVDRAGNPSSWTYGASFVVDGHQETSGTIAYSGAWTQQSAAPAYGGALKYAGAAGARARLGFTGRGVAWVTSRGPDRGKAEVWVDGVKAGTVDLYSSAPRSRKVVFTKGWTAPGAHTLEVRVLGASNLASSGTRVDVDAFVALR